MPGQAQLGQMPSAYLGGYVPKSPRQPHLWQQALAQFLGNTAGQIGQKAVTSAMAPSSTTGPDGKVTINPAHWYQQMTPDQRLQVAMGNAQIGQTGAQTGLIGQEAGQVAPNAAATRALQGAQTGLTGAETAQVAPNAAATRALQGAETGLTSAQAAGEPGLMAGQAGYYGGLGKYYSQMQNWMPQETQARIGQMGAQTQEVQQDIMNKKMQQALEQKTLLLGLPNTTLMNLGFDSRNNPQEYGRAQRAISQVPLPADGNFMNYQAQIRQAALDARLHPEKYDETPAGPMPQASAPLAPATGAGSWSSAYGQQ